jgi:uncharacterized protein (DUF1684 family)
MLLLINYHFKIKGLRVKNFRIKKFRGKPSPNIYTRIAKITNIMKISNWKKTLEEERELKDGFFKAHPQSPIPLEERMRFKRLEYYPPDPNYRFELELHEHDEKKSIKIAYTMGEMKEFTRWGEFRFKIGDQEQVLQAYKSSSEEELLSIFFRDATSGKETYGAGRYLDLEPERNCTIDGKWILDFNKAYNPWCAYSEAYTCPFVPPENWLKVPIRAGEKLYVLKK